MRYHRLAHYAPTRSCALFLFAVLFVGTAFANYTFQKEANHVYLCTFNVFRLGDIEPEYDRLDEDDGEPHVVPDRIKNLARVLASADFDLIVLQEVTEGDKGQWALSDLVEELNTIHQRHYQFLLSGGIGMGLMPEAMAFIYDPNKIKPQPVSGTVFTANIPISGRDLVKTKWIAGNFDFTLVSAHLAWGNHPDRKEGDEKLRDILEHPSSYSDDPDIVILGDTNRFGDGAEFWPGFAYHPSNFLAPNLACFDPQFNQRKEVKAAHLQGTSFAGMNPQFLSTTVAANTFVYDVFLLTSDVDEELPGSANTLVYGQDWGIVHFDEPGGFGHQSGAEALNSNDLKSAYSDHRPLWMRFRTDLNHADGSSAAPATITYVATAFGKKFHLPGCKSIANSTVATTWTSRAEALTTHGPCSVCKP
jgi:endonuclease/exonuclease/phosphatase family metal-dependent hydrolase